MILTDTGYLFPETYRFIDELTQQLNLNLQIFRAETSPAWQARYGKLWEQGVEGIEQYNQLNKVEPMNRALRTLGAQTVCRPAPRSVWQPCQPAGTGRAAWRVQNPADHRLG